MNVEVIALPAERAGSLARLRDFVELTKPRIAILELVTVAIGACVASAGNPDWWLLLHALVGTTLIAASASTFNQLMEIRSDLLMRRTKTRPLPAGRISRREAFWFGSLTLLAGVAYLAAFVNSTTLLLGLLSWQLYVMVYTPMKAWSSWNTLIGAIPGALPIMMGWTAMEPKLGFGPGLLFAIVFVWQFPHFMAIAWLCRHEYRQARIHMVSCHDAKGNWTAAIAVGGAFVLLVVSLLPTVFGYTGQWYLFGATAWGLALLGTALAFNAWRDDTSARWLLRMSLLYLPAVLAMLLIDLV